MGPEGNFGPPLRDLKLPLGPSLRGRVPGRGRARRRVRARVAWPEGPAGKAEPASREDQGDARTQDAEDAGGGRTGRRVRPARRVGMEELGPGSSGIEAKVTSPVLLHGESYLCLCTWVGARRGRRRGRGGWGERGRGRG